MYRIYEKVTKSEEYKYGMRQLEVNENPFKEGPCLISMIAYAHFEKDINGALNYGMEALRLKTSHNNNTGLELKDFPGRVLSISYGEKEIDTEEKGALFNGTGRREILDNEFAKKYLYPLIEENGKKIDVMQAMKNMRNINFLTFCAAVQSAIQMEDCLVERMRDLGYTDKEIDQIQSQMSILTYATRDILNREVIEGKKVKSTYLMVGDSNDIEFEATKKLKDAIEEKKVLYFENNGYYYFKGSGNHEVNDYITEVVGLAAPIANFVTKALGNSIENAKGKDFIPISNQIVSKDMDKIIEGIRSNKSREEIFSIIENDISYNSLKKEKEDEVFDEI